MEIKDIIYIAIAVASLIFGIYQFRKSRKLEHEKFLYEMEKDAKQELKEIITGSQEKGKKKTDAQVYCEHVSLKFKHLDFTGLNAILQKPLLLEQVYVKLRAKKSFRLPQYQTIADFKQLDEERGNEETGKTEEKDEDFVTVFETLHREYNLKREPLKLVILGHPGSGKTTLMKWIALQCACGGDTVFGRFIPVFIPLKDFGRDPQNTFRTKNIREFTVELLKKEALSASFFDERFEAGTVLFLLDGLDEVADETVRKDVIQWIQNQSIRRNSLLVTSRFSGLQEAKGLKFPDAVPVFSVRDFDIADIERFLENWYRNIETAVAGNASEEDIAQAVKKGKERTEDLISVIKSGNYQNLRRLAVNPLLLTIIAIVRRTRAVLPKERHKLYEECLKVMIELWNVANRKIDEEASFSVENSMANLSKIAVFLMKENRREMELKDILGILPSEIEGRSRDFFLKEMVLKAGLLYESEGKYGFLHLTFQEYLAAHYFARGGNQNTILDYRDKDYWTETFKLFVNIGNARLFFDEIIDHLIEKEYWRQINLWDDCLRDIVVEETREEIELKFAETVLDILPEIDYKEENEELISQLYLHYPIYTHATRFVEKGWNLFDHALHPFVRSVGSFVLNGAGDDIQAQLVERIKERIESFEKRDTKDPGQWMEFLFENNNSFVVLIAGRKNLTDFNFALVKFKSRDFLIVYLDILYIRNLLHLLDIRYLLDIENFIDFLGFQDKEDFPDNIFHSYSRYFRCFRYIQFRRDPIGYILLFRRLNPQNFRYLQDRFIKKYQSVIKEHKKEIDQWADKALAKLHAMSGEELKDRFPGTSEEDLKRFRESDQKPRSRKTSQGPQNKRKPRKKEG
jgi:DNA replication protein DnaC